MSQLLGSGTPLRPIRAENQIRDSMHRISEASKDRYKDSKNPNTPPRFRSSSFSGEDIKSPTSPKLEKLVLDSEVPVLSCTPPTPRILHPEPVPASGFIFDTGMHSYESISAPPRPCTLGSMLPRPQTPPLRSQSAEPSYSSGSPSSADLPSIPTLKAQKPRPRASSLPNSTTLKVKCSGTTVAGRPCKKDAIEVVDSAMANTQPDKKIERFCHHHQKKIYNMTGTSDSNPGGPKTSAEAQKGWEALMASAAWLADCLSADLKSLPEAFEDLMFQRRGRSLESESGDSRSTNETTDPKPVTSPNSETLFSDERPPFVISDSKPLPNTGDGLGPNVTANYRALRFAWVHRG